MPCILKSPALRVVLISAFFLAIAAGCSDSGGGGSKCTAGGGVIPVTVSGTVSYEDREYDHLGFTGVLGYKPVRHAYLEVLASLDGSLLATGGTDAAGAYSMDFTHASGACAYVRVLSTTFGIAGAPEVSVYSPSAFGLFAYGGADFSVRDGGIAPVEVRVPYASGFAGAFNILDVMAAAGKFLNSTGGAFPPALDVYWEEGSSDGTYFSPLGGSIHIRGTASDTDEYDDDVLWHEYGHFAANAFSVDDSEGGDHALTDNDLDLRLSFSEGWGGYFTGAVKRWLSSEPLLANTVSSASGLPLTFYVDTDSDGTLNSKDLGNPGGLPYMYCSNEVAVAKVLLDLDSLYGPAMVWEIVDNLAAFLDASEQTTLEAFWDGWLATNGTADLAFWESVMAERMVYYMMDVFESMGDDTMNPARLATPGQGEVHYIYNSSGLADTDYIAFNATTAGSYIIQTYCMKNGADTYLSIVNSSGAPLSGAADDDTFNSTVCGPDMFSQYASTVAVSITEPGIYYAVVNTSGLARAYGSPDIYPYPGRYGTYTIMVSGP